MINFRYHVLSVVAVFVALAAGLGLGTAALNGSVSDGRAGSLRAANDRYRDQVRQLTAEAAKQQDFDRQLAPRLLADTLANHSVLVLTLPGADREAVAGVEQMLGYSGATVTGEVAVRSEFTDPANADALGDLAGTQLPVDIHQSLPNHGDGVESAAALLAAVLMTDTDTVSTDSRTTVLTALETGGNIGVVKPVTGAADAVLIVAGDAATGADAATRNTATLTVVRQFVRAGQAVVGGEGADGNAVAAVRRDGSLAATVSTVDTLNLVQGQLASALAVAAQLAGTVGQYGVAAGATRLAPNTD